MLRVEGFPELPSRVRGLILILDVPDQVPVPVVGILGRPFLRFIVNIDRAETLGETRGHSNVHSGIHGCTVEAVHRC